ncbi:hypothetical protein GON09_003477 [Rhodococcus sp. B50]|nr:hypothetical protein [Rhodococcus sp. B50]
MRALVEAAFMAIHTPLVDAYTFLISILPA